MIGKPVYSSKAEKAKYTKYIHVMENKEHVTANT